MAHELVVLHGSNMPECKHVVDKHLDGYSSIQMMTSGGVSLSYDKTNYSLTQPAAWAAWPGPHVKFARKTGFSHWNHRYVAFAGGLANKWKEYDLLPTQPILLQDVDQLIPLFDEVLDGIYHTDKLDTLRTINGIERLLFLIKDNEIKTAPSGLVEAAKQYINLRRIDEIDYELLARENAVALSTLRRKFKNDTGIALHTYALNNSINKAKEKLTNSDLPIKSIALDLGFSDVYYFTRQFTQISGVSPARFRKSL